MALLLIGRKFGAKSPGLDGFCGLRDSAALQHTASARLLLARKGRRASHIAGLNLAALPERDREIIALHCLATRDHCL